jgi:hypothetical protein
MKRTTSRGAVALSVVVGLTVLSGAAAAQSINDVAVPTEPLILKQQGSFFVGGRQTQSDATGWDQTPPVSDFGSGDVTVDQMYVQFQIPVTLGSRSRVPLVFVHGCCLSSKTWETTPDGRMGWYEYFTRLGHPTYLAEQSGRARSGFNGTIYNEVKLGEKAPKSSHSFCSRPTSSRGPSSASGRAMASPGRTNSSRSTRSTSCSSR